MKCTQVRYDFESSFPKLNDHTKELIGTGSWSMYKISTGEYFIKTDGGCPCCHGTRQKAYYLVDVSGEYKSVVDAAYYQKLLDQDLILELVSFNIPERISKYYLKITL
jgi:hypothetical protein